MLHDLTGPETWETRFYPGRLPTWTGVKILLWNLLCKHTLPGYPDSRLTAVLEHPIFSCRDSRSLSGGELRQAREKKKKPKECASVHGQGAVLSLQWPWANSITGLDSPLYLLSILPQGLWKLELIIKTIITTTIAGKSVYEDAMGQRYLIPYPTLSSLEVMLARTLFLYKSIYTLVNESIFFFISGSGLKVF